MVSYSQQKGNAMLDNGRVIALLIDAENVSPKYMKVILEELSLYGTPAYKRIYGDWTNPEMSSWKKRLLENNLTPIQQFSYTQGKNASDSAMIIDAMDILYANNCDGFCLISSDSDFTRLASRLRESRMYVIGMGESKTPMAFKSACDTFKYLDVLLKSTDKDGDKAEKARAPRRGAKPAPKPKESKAAPEKAAAAEPLAEPPMEPPMEPPAEPPAEAPVSADAHEEASGFVPLEEIVERIKDIVDHDSDEDGFMSLAQVGSILGRQYVDFDTRNYGFSKLHKLIDYTGEFETKYESIPGGGRNLMLKSK